MSGRYLLDTNIIIALLADEKQIQDKLREVEEVFVPSIVIGELYFGAYKSVNVEANMSRIDELAAHAIVLDCGAETARHYSEAKNALRLKGRPIPENDIWIAAIAVQHGLTLVSRDTHFEELEYLGIEVW
jgi:tRNA(fMet)-specific endonuclease VapC